MNKRYRSFQTQDEAITDGIVIKSWEVPLQDDKVTYSIWDFAGQTVYYNTHQVTQHILAWVISWVGKFEFIYKFTSI